MFPNVEAEFRVAERQLDDLLRRDRVTVEARGIEVRDDSARSYHYKNELLAWAFAFETRASWRSEVEKVRVGVSVHESDLTIAQIGWHAELFEVGAASRWQQRGGYTLPLPQLVNV